MSGVVKGLVQVVGNAVVDVLVRDVEEKRGTATDTWGANVQLLKNPVEATLGGCGAAPAYLLGRLGQRVRLQTNLGRDSWGDLIRTWLRQGEVEIGEAGFPATAVNVIALTPEGKRRSLYYTGEKVEWRGALGEEMPEWLLASGYGKVERKDLVEMRELFGELRRWGTKVMFDPSPWFAGRVEKEEMLATWREVDCLVGTQEELGVWMDAEDAGELAGQILATGPELVAVKRGVEGAVFATRMGEKGSFAAERVSAANSVGAGDTFNGRLLFGLCRGEGADTAVAAAVIMATQVVLAGRGVLGALE
jgi:fructokinase